MFFNEMVIKPEPLVKVEPPHGNDVQQRHGTVCSQIKTEQESYGIQNLNCEHSLTPGELREHCIKQEIETEDGTIERTGAVKKEFQDDGDSSGIKREESAAEPSAINTDTELAYTTIAGVERPTRDDSCGRGTLLTRSRPYTCGICNRTFSYKGYFIRHVRAHADKPHGCGVCGRKFLHSKKLETHMRTHDGERPYCCQICKRYFSDRRVLSKHERTHSGEKPHRCDICNRTFSNRSNLIVHIRTHTGEKPYACHLCDLKFAAHSSLERHKRTHTGEKPYSCDACDRKFGSSSNLKTHKKKTHALMCINMLTPKVCSRNVP